MKKLTVIILTMLLALNLCACNGGKKPAAYPSTGSNLTAEEIERLAEEALEQEAGEAAQN